MSRSTDDSVLAVYTDLSSPSMTPDGRYVVFLSMTSQVPEVTGLTRQVYVRDRQTNTTTLVSKSDGGVPADGNVDSPSISADGRYVVFLSYVGNLVSASDNLVSNDTNGERDVFIHALDTGVTRRVSTGVGDVQAKGPSSVSTSNRVAALSNDGSWVAFNTLATNIGGISVPIVYSPNVVLRNWVTDQAVAVTDLSFASGGVLGCTVSGDGRYAGFISSAPLDSRFPSSVGGIYVSDLMAP